MTAPANAPSPLDTAALPLLDDPARALPLAFRMLRMDEDALAEALHADGFRVPAAILAASAVSFALGTRSWGWLLLRPVAVVLFLGFTHLAATRKGGPGAFVPLARAYLLLMVPDVLGILGPLGSILVALGTLYAVALLIQLLGVHHGLGPVPAIQCIVAGASGTALALALLAVLQGAMWGHSGFERRDKAIERQQNGMLLAPFLSARA
jgi:hypothetical protein